MEIPSIDLIEEVERSMAVRKQRTVLVTLAISLVGVALQLTVTYPSWLPHRPSEWLFLFALVIGFEVVHQQSGRNEKRLLARLREVETHVKSSVA